MQGCRHRQRGRRCCRQQYSDLVPVRRFPAPPWSAPRQRAVRRRRGLLSPQRYRKTGRHCRPAFARAPRHRFAEPIEGQTRDVGPIPPGRQKFRTKGDHQQHRQPPNPVDGQIQQLARCRIDPMGILKEDRTGPCRASASSWQRNASNSFSLFRWGLRLSPRQNSATTATRSTARYRRHLASPA